MTQKEIDHIRKRDSWREIIAKQKESGKSIAAYCRENSITPNQFWYWQKTITKELISDAQLVGVLNTPVTISGADEVAATAKEVVSKVVKKTTGKEKKSKQPATLAPVVNAIVHGEKEIDTQAQLSVDGVVFDIGGTTSTALHSGVGSSGERSNGNGSLMRIAPLAFVRCIFADLLPTSSWSVA